MSTRFHSDPQTSAVLEDLCHMDGWGSCVSASRDVVEYPNGHELWTITMLVEAKWRGQCEG